MVSTLLVMSIAYAIQDIKSFLCDAKARGGRFSSRKPYLDPQKLRTGRPAGYALRRGR